MPNLQSWEFICRHPSDIPPGVPRTLTPPGARECVSPELVARMGGTVSQLYPEFASNFPLTVAAMQRCYSPPVLILETIALRWIHMFLIEGSNDNIVFPPVSPSSSKSGAVFDGYMQCCLFHGGSCTGGWIHSALRIRPPLALGSSIHPLA